jgi:hypothetical protein
VRDGRNTFWKLLGVDYVRMQKHDGGLSFFVGLQESPQVVQRRIDAVTTSLTQRFRATTNRQLSCQRVDV